MDLKNWWRHVLAGATLGVALWVVAGALLQPFLPADWRAPALLPTGDLVQAVCTLAAAAVAFLAVGYQIATQREDADRRRWADQLAALQVAWVRTGVIRILTKQSLDMALKAKDRGRQLSDPMPFQEVETRQQCAEIAAIDPADLPVDARATWIIVARTANDLVQVFELRKSATAHSWPEVEQSMITKLEELVRYLNTGPDDAMRKSVNRVRSLMGLPPADKSETCLAGVQP